MVLLRLSERECQPRGVISVRGFFLYQKNYLPQKKHKIFMKQIVQQFYLPDQGLNLIHGDKQGFSSSSQQ